MYRFFFLSCERRKKEWLLLCVQCIVERAQIFCEFLVPGYTSTSAIQLDSSTIFVANSESQSFLIHVFVFTHCAPSIVRVSQRVALSADSSFMPIHVHRLVVFHLFDFLGFLSVTCIVERFKGRFLGFVQRAASYASKRFFVTSRDLLVQLKT